MQVGTLSLKKIEVSRRGTTGRCETSKLFCIENMHENVKDGILKKINVA